MAKTTTATHEFLVNTTTAGIQYEPTITALPDGRFVVVWSDTSNGVDVDIRARVFNADGSPMADEFAVGSTVADQQYEPAVSALQDGRFVVTWSDTSNGTDVDVRARIFNGDGSPSAGEFIVTTMTAADQFEPTVATLADGRFVATWADNSGASCDIHARVFHADGTPASADFVINSTAARSQYQPVITALPDGRFAIAWTDDSRSGGDVSSLAIRAAVFNPDGSAAKREFLVNSTSAGPQLDPTITALADGRFVVAWADFSGSGSDPSLGAIRARVFAADFTPLGDDFVVNTTTNNYQGQPSLAALPDGRFVVTWEDFSQSGGDQSWLAIRGQVLNPDGSRWGSEFLVNTTTTDHQYDPSVTGLADGRFAVAWADHSGTGGDAGWAVHARIFAPETPRTDFNGDRMGDILWQNDDGRAAISLLDERRSSGRAICAAMGRVGMPKAWPTSTATGRPTFCGRTTTAAPPYG
jgi:hypothetical protein